MNNAVETLSIKGFRGFAEREELKLAKPTGTTGSGLTILVGPNNGGKSTITEALDAVFRDPPLSFAVGKRNQAAGDRISLKLKLASGTTHELCSIAQRRAKTHHPNGHPPSNTCFYLPSRRLFSPYFGEAIDTRDSYISNQVSSIQGTRNNPLNRFSARLFKVLDDPKNRDEFNKLMKQVVDPVPEWTIDLSDQERFFVRVDAGEQYHTSDGVGDGIVSLLFIVDALYDSEPGQLIVIDEPELSLHPAFQRRLARLFADYAKDRQIVYATHSPYFVDFNFVVNGATVARVHKPDNRCVVSHLSSETAKALGGLLKDDHNPHVLGLDARESLFQDDGVIVVEGQDDVVHYPKILDQLGMAEELKDRFFGWGAGGAGKVEKVLPLFRDLGYEQVAVILDGNERHRIQQLQDDFPKYHFYAIPADDVRNKKCRSARPAVCGLLDGDRLKPQFQNDLVELFEGLAKVLAKPESTTIEAPRPSSTKP